MEILKGKLEFISLFQPINLFVEGKTIDLGKIYFSLFEKLNGVKSSMNEVRDVFEICADENSEKTIQYENDENGILIILKNKDFGWSNIGAYLPNALQSLNGRQVVVEILDNGIKISNNPDEKVFGVSYTRNNSCGINDDDAKSICKIGESDCCIFCSVGSDGFECLKFDSFLARHLLDRHSKKDMRASRIGDCKNIGRKENS